MQQQPTRLQQSERQLRTAQRIIRAHRATARLRSALVNDYRDPRDYITGRVNYVGGREAFREDKAHRDALQTEGDVLQTEAMNREASSTRGNKSQPPRL